MPGIEMCIKLTMVNIDDYNSFILLDGIVIFYDIALNIWISIADENYILTLKTVLDVMS